MRLPKKEKKEKIKNKNKKTPNPAQKTQSCTLQLLQQEKQDKKILAHTTYCSVLGRSVFLSLYFESTYNILEVSLAAYTYGEEKLLQTREETGLTSYLTSFFSSPGPVSPKPGLAWLGDSAQAGLRGRRESTLMIKRQEMGRRQVLCPCYCHFKPLQV